MDQILDGVGWLIDEGGKVTKKPVDDGSVNLTHQYIYYGMNTKGEYNSVQSYCNANLAALGSPAKLIQVNSSSCVFDYGSGRLFTHNVSRKANPNYNPSAPPPANVLVSDGEMEDAFYNWFKNNTHSLTDPVTTYIYSPKDSQGNALPKSPEGSDPSFGPNEITDEMMDNYMEHRDANLQNPYTTSIQDSTQTDTTQNPDGSKTTTTTNPDGSKTTTRTDTKTDPDTGEVTTTVTETTTMPDGSTSTKTETSTQTKPNPETTELPAFCEYAATLCTWMNRDTDHKADEKSVWEK